MLRAVAEGGRGAPGAGRPLRGARLPRNPPWAPTWALIGYRAAYKPLAHQQQPIIVNLSSARRAPTQRQLNSPLCRFNKDRAKAPSGPPPARSSSALISEQPLRPLPTPPDRERAPCSGIAGCRKEGRSLRAEVKTPAQSESAKPRARAHCPPPPDHGLRCPSLAQSPLPQPLHSAQEQASPRKPHLPSTPALFCAMSSGTPGKGSGYYPPPDLTPAASSACHAISRPRLCTPSPWRPPQTLPNSP